MKVLRVQKPTNKSNVDRSVTISIMNNFDFIDKIGVLYLFVFFLLAYEKRTNLLKKLIFKEAET